jgi:hypothetical protein
VFPDRPRHDLTDRWKLATYCFPWTSRFARSAYVRLCVKFERSVSSGRPKSRLRRVASIHLGGELVPSDRLKKFGSMGLASQPSAIWCIIQQFCIARITPQKRSFLRASRNRKLSTENGLNLSPSERQSSPPWFQWLKSNRRGLVARANVSQCRAGRKCCPRPNPPDRRRGALC